MSTTLVLIGLGALLAASLFIVSQRKRYRIRRTGTLVMARVTQVKSWRDPPRAEFSPFLLLGERWWYEICAEWTDPHTQNTYVLTSGVKKGLSRYQRGDPIPAYVSPYGNYLELS